LSRRLEVIHSGEGRFGKQKKKSFSLPGIKLLFPDCPALSVIIIPIMLKVIFEITSDK
jgi:hypothetical protein